MGRYGCSMNVTTKVGPPWPIASGFFEVPRFVVYSKIGNLVYSSIYLNVYTEHEDYYMRVGYYGRNQG